MIKKLIILTLLVGTCLPVAAQELYKDGYVLKTALDTLHGQIRYISYNQAAGRCVFRDTTGLKTAYSPKDIYGYGIDNELLFHSKILDNKQHIFLEVLYQGSVSLYGYRDANQRNFFYLENAEQGEFRALTQKVIAEGRRRKVIKPYVDVLKIMLPGYELVADEIETAPLSSKGLSRLLIAYDERYAQTKGISYTGLRKSRPPTISIMAGTSHSRLTLNGHSGRESLRSFITGIRLEKEVSKNTGRLFLDVDLTISTESYNGIFKADQILVNGSDIVSNNINITSVASAVGLLGQIEYNTAVALDRTFINLPIGLKYKLPGRRFNVTFGGGLEFQLATTDEVLVDGQILQNGIIEIGLLSSEKANPFRTGINFGAGISYNTFRTIFLDLRHSPSFFDQGALNYGYTRVMIGIQLSKNN